MNLRWSPTYCELNIAQLTLTVISQFTFSVKVDLLLSIKYVKDVELQRQHVVCCCQSNPACGL